MGQETAQELSQPADRRAILPFRAGRAEFYAVRLWQGMPR